MAASSPSEIVIADVAAPVVIGAVLGVDSVFGVAAEYKRDCVLD
jgi:hypothetical protein